MKLETKSKLGWPAIIILSLVPVVIWATAYPLEFRFLGPNSSRTFSQTMNSVGQILGLVGMVMFSLNFVLSMRVKWIEDYFGGMNKVYIAHHILGALSFVLLLLHPLFLTARYIPTAGDGTIKMFLFSSDTSINYGVIALGLMIIFLILTFYIKLPYQLWKFTHKFLGLAFFFGALHALMIPSDITSIESLKYYMFTIILLGFMGVIYRTLLAVALVPKETFLIENISNISPTIWEITLKHISGKQFNFTPGQFIFIGFPNSNGLEEVHPFSISSQPEGDRVRIGVKALGDFTKRLGELKVGQTAIIEGPFGRTSYRYIENKKQIWVAGGIGITPFLGMARSMTSENGYEIDCYFSLIDRSDTPFVAELESIAERCPNFRFIPWYSKESGYLNVDAIIKQSEGIVGKDILLCGPPPMMKGIKEQLRKYHVPSRMIHSEEFSLN